MASTRSFVGTLEVILVSMLRYARSRATASQSISMPSPGPVGTGSMPFFCRSAPGAAPVRRGLERTGIGFAFHGANVRHRRGKMHARRFADDAGHADMGRVLNIVRCGELGHATRLADAAGTGDVRLKVGERPVGDEPHRLIEGDSCFRLPRAAWRTGGEVPRSRLRPRAAAALRTRNRRCRTSARPTSTASSSV